MKRLILGLVGVLVAALVLILSGLQLGIVPQTLITATLGLRYPDIPFNRLFPQDKAAPSLLRLEPYASP